MVLKSVTANSASSDAKIQIGRAHDQLRVQGICRTSAGLSYRAARRFSSAGDTGKFQPVAVARGLDDPAVMLGGVVRQEIAVLTQKRLQIRRQQFAETGCRAADVGLHDHGGTKRIHSCAVDPMRPLGRSLRQFLARWEGSGSHPIAHGRRRLRQAAVALHAHRPGLSLGAVGLPDRLPGLFAGALGAYARSRDPVATTDRLLRLRAHGGHYSGLCKQGPTPRGS